MVKLNVGSNTVSLNGWTNIDINAHAGVTIIHDARNKFPFEDNSVDFIFSEHFIEHLTADEALNFFKECYRMLKPGGVVRTSTFCIDDIMKMCSSDQSWDEYSKIYLGGIFKDYTRIEFLNLCIYEGTMHKWMFNANELERLQRLSGFNNINKPEIKQSTYSELQNLEWRANSNCITEAIK